MKKNNDAKDDFTNGREVPGSQMPTQSWNTCPGAAGYEIRFKDHLETCWFEWFEGWSVTNLENGEVLLKSSMVDQSRLHGALNKIRNLNLTLLSVSCLPADSQILRENSFETKKSARNYKETPK